MAEGRGCDAESSFPPAPPCSNHLRTKPDYFPVTHMQILVPSREGPYLSMAEVGAGWGHRCAHRAMCNTPLKTVAGGMIGTR